MTKYIFVILIFFSALSIAQERNKIETDEKSDKPMLMGYCDRSALNDTSFSWRFNSEYDGTNFKIAC